MTRFASAAAESASGASLLQYRQLVDMGVTSGTIYACTGNQWITPSMTYALANTYSPVGALGGIEAVEENADGSPRTLRLWLQAVNSNDLYQPAREDMFNRPVTVRHCYLDPIAGTLVGTPENIWGGFINRVEIRFADVERGNFYEVEAETSRRRKAEALNFTRETLQTVLSQSGDTFFDFIHQVPLTKALWGQRPTVFGGRYPGGFNDQQGRVWDIAGAVIGAFGG